MLDKIYEIVEKQYFDSGEAQAGQNDYLSVTTVAQLLATILGRMECRKPSGVKLLQCDLPVAT